MMYRAVLLLSLVMLVGCGATSSFKNPLAGMFKKDKRIDPDAPPRYDQVAEAPAGQVRVKDDLAAPNPDIELTDFVAGSQDMQYTGATVVARVNGKPIFAEDVLQPKANEFAKAALQLTPEELNKLRATFIQNNLPPHIEQAVLVTALKNDIPREQWEELNEKVKVVFDSQEIDRLKRVYKVTTRTELDRELTKLGTSIDKLRGMFADQQLAVYYIKDNNQPKQVQYSRKDLLNWYEQNIYQFKFNSRVRWRQVRINYRRGSSTSVKKAEETIATVIEQFRQRVPFEQIARTYSNGPKAAEGGQWDWTDKGNLAEEKVDRALFELVQGQPSEVLDTGNAFVIVEVLERTKSGYEPFENVQDEIAKKLQQSVRSTDTGKFIDELVQSATVWTAFGSPRQSARRQ
jgi:parvulin-like peptidyl-prolyl isomerase